MLTLKPSCENCDCQLPPDSQKAMICSYECTFCEQCVSQILKNVCPNCGGGFCPRPVRPKREWRKGVSLTQHPASDKKVYKPVEPQAQSEFAKPIESLSPHLR